MTDPRDELVEKVVDAIREAKDSAPNDGKPLGYHLADAAIAVVLEEAAKLAEAKADEWATVWRNHFKVDSHMEGQSDGAHEIAVAIRALISKETA